MLDDVLLMRAEIWPSYYNVRIKNQSRRLTILGTRERPLDPQEYLFTSKHLARYKWGCHTREECLRLLQE
jgi:hypothetical protein